MRNFTGSIVFTVASLILAGTLGWYETGLASAALQMVFLAGVLGVMETSLSLDNAVVNASVLKDMNPVWQRRFLTWGILIAVFGMRILFPILIVAVAAMVSPLEAAHIALTDHQRYEAIVTDAHLQIAGFGGAFLLMVGLTFFFDPDREHHWIKPVEAVLAECAKMPMGTYMAAWAAIIAACFLIEPSQRSDFAVAGLCGLLAYWGVDKIGDLIGGNDSGADAAAATARTGLGGFIYLEFLDASFSFDGVIGAFAITNDILLIALGLGIGAMFVRSMTVALVRGGHLAEYRYLETGAFYAILALAGIMILGIRFHIPEAVTGLAGAAIIATSLWASIRHKRAFPHEYEDSAPVILPTGDVLSGRTV